MPPGYHGCYLRIDVSSGRAEQVPLSDTLLREYIGGSGLGTRLVLDEGGALADPLSPDAPLAFAFSPLVGTPLTTSDRKSTRLNSSHMSISYAVFCLKKKKQIF